MISPTVAILAESLDVLEYHSKVTNATVQRIQIIIITPINSTKVKAFLFTHTIMQEINIK